MKEKLINLCAFYILSWLLYPPLFSSGLARALFALCFVLFVFLTWENIFRKIRYVFLPIISIFLLSTFSYLRYGFGDYSAYSTVVWYLIFFSISILFAYYSDVGFNRFKRIFFFFLIGLIFFNITTILSLYVNPNVSRLLTGNAEYQLASIDLSTRELLFTGRFPYIYSAVFLSSICVMVFPLKSVSKWEKFLIGGYLASAVVMILMASYSIATVTLLVGIFLALINKRLSIFLTIFGAFVFAFLFSLLKPSIYDVLIYFAGDNESYISKIEAVFNPTTSGGEMDSRIEVWKTSLMSFFKNPLFGGGESGGHSCILDLLGRYGLLIGGPCICAIVYPVFVVKEKMKKIGRSGVVNCFLLLFLLVLLFNPIQYPYGAVVFALFPYACFFYFMREGNGRFYMSKIQRMK